MCRYGELVASHPVKAIIGCFIVTALGGAGLFRWWHSKLEHLPNLRFLCRFFRIQTLKLATNWFFCAGFMRRVMPPPWSSRSTRSSGKTSTGSTTTFPERWNMKRSQAFFNQIFNAKLASFFYFHLTFNATLASWKLNITSIEPNNSTLQFQLSSSDPCSLSHLHSRQCPHPRGVF